MRRNDVTGCWLTVLGSLLAMTVGNGPIMQLMFGVFLKPLADEFGVGRDAISLALLFGLLSTAFAMPAVGLLLDRYGVHRVVVPAIVLLAASIASVGLFATSPVALIAIYCIMGLFAAGHTPIPYALAVSKAFNEGRGLAIGIAMTGVGIGMVILPYFLQWIIALNGWRFGYLGLAGLLVMIAVPAVVFLVRDRRIDRADANLRKAADVGLMAIRTEEFIVLGIAILCLATTSSGIIAHVVALMSDWGTSSSLATSALSIIGIASIIGRLIAGYLLDRVFAIHVLMTVVAVQIVGIVLMVATDSPWIAMIGVVLVGLAFGSIINIMAFVTSLFFDMRAFSQIYGYMFAIFMIGSAIGPLVMGIGYARTGDYRLPLACLALSLVCACGLLARIGSPPATRLELTPS